MNKKNRASDYRIDAIAGIVYGIRGRSIGCPTSSGYIAIGRGGYRDMSAHRMIWESVHGPIPAGLQINHINGIKTDNRIANLELVTPKQNIQHAHRNGLCENRPTGERIGTSKLTGHQVKEVLARLKSGITQRKLASEYGVSQSVISDIARGVSWRSISPIKRECIARELFA